MHVDNAPHSLNQETTGKLPAMNYEHLKKSGNKCRINSTSGPGYIFYVLPVLELPIRYSLGPHTLGSLFKIFIICFYYLTLIHQK